MENVALYGWYTKYREEAFLPAIRAAQASPDDGLLLNNCAADPKHKAVRRRRPYRSFGIFYNLIRPMAWS